MSLNQVASLPGRGGLIERPRLLEKLKRAAEHKLTIVCAPPGYGKTTLVTQYVRHSPYPVVWHTVEERERDIPILQARCLAVLSQVLPDVQTLQPIYGYPAHELAILLADYLRDALPGDIIYILDDAHLLAASQAAESWLKTFVTHLPPNCHLILLSRIPPDLPISHLIAKGEVQAIGQEELRLTSREIEQLAEEMVGSTPSQDEMENLVNRIGGWPAGTVLALQPFPPEFEQAIFRGRAGPEALFDSLAAAMLNGLSPGLRDFLLSSSTPSRITPELCAVALELPNSDEWLAQTQSRNLFVSRVTGGLVYHMLFRSFLQRELYQLDRERFVTLHAKAGRWFEEHDHLDEAFDHFVAAGLVERAAGIAERAAQAYFSQGKVETLLGWQDALKQVGAASPKLLAACAKIHIERYEYPTAEAELDEAEMGFAKQNNPAWIADIHLHRAIMNLQRGEFRQAVAQAVTILEQEPEAILRGEALNVLGTAYLYLGEAETAVKFLEEALSLFRAEADASSLATLLQNLDAVYIRLGQFDKATAYLQEVVALRRSLGSAGLLALALNNLGYHYHQHGNYQQALATYQEGLSVIARVPNRRSESYLLWSLGDLQRDRGALNEAMQVYDKALELIGGSEPVLRCALLISASVLRRWQGNLFDAVSLAGEAAALAQAHSMAVEGTTAQAALWAARAEMGKAAEALQELEALAANLPQQSSTIELVYLLGLCAYAALLCSDESLAEHYLESAVHHARKVGSAQPLAAEVAHAPSLEALVNNAPARYDVLIDHLKLLRQAQSRPVEEQPKAEKPLLTDTYSLRVFILGREIIERDGKRIPSSVWRASGARELFFYLLFVGPSTKDQICLAFWPDSSNRQVRNNFHTTLHRARQALGQNVITFRDNLYLLNTDLEIWCDALELEALGRQTRLLSQRDARTEDLYRRAVTLYQGEFLLSLDTDWIVARRESLHDAYLQAMVGLAGCARARGDYREALIRYRNVLAVEPYREDIHQAIMTCYHKLGEKSRIPTHMRQFEALLLEDLGVEPSEETIQLARRLLGDVSHSSQPIR